MIETDPGAKYVYRNRWIAKLNDGTEVFEDRVPHQPSAWLRLQDYLKETGLRLVGLELYCDGVSLTMPKDVDGFFQSKRLKHWSASGHEIHEHGIGYVRDNTIFISWISENQKILEETRPLNRNNPAIIFLESD